MSPAGDVQAEKCLIYDDRAALIDRPGLHALLIGVSDYPNLPPVDNKPSPDAGKPDFGLRPLSASARSANRLARWIVDHRDRFPVPLATCRLLISPSAAEKSDPILAGHGAPSDRPHVEQAAASWRAAAATHPDSIAFFYFAGHGLQRRHLETVTDHVLLLSEFWDGKGTVLKDGFSIQDLIDAMAPGREEFTKIARTQYFFFDACRNAPAALEKLDRTSCPYILDISERTAYDDRRKAVFQTTEPDRRAYADPNGLTHFAAALLKCLEGGVGVLDQTIIDPTQPRWNLTIGALDQGANYYLRIENDLRNVSQRAQPTITMSYDTIFCRLDAPPKVPYRVLLDPASACDYTLVELCAERDGLTWKLPKPVKPHPYDSLVSGGFYRYRATLDSPAGGAPLTSSPFLLQTPGALVKVVVSGLQS